MISQGWPIFLDVCLVVAAVVACLSCLLLLVNPRKPRNLNKEVIKLPDNHPMKLAPDEWEAWYVMPADGFEGWLWSAFQILDSSGVRRGMVRYTNRKEFIKEDGSKLHTPIISRYSVDSVRDFFIGDKQVAKVTSSPLDEKCKVQIAYQGRSIVRRDTCSTVFIESVQFFENGQLIADRRRVSSVFGRPNLFCFRRGLDEDLKGLMVLYGII